MWQSFEIKGSEETLDGVLPGLVAPFYQHSNRDVVVDRFFFVRTSSDISTLHVSANEAAAQPVADYLRSCSSDRGVQISPCPSWKPALSLTRAARRLMEGFAEHSSRHSLYLLTRPKPERLARMCFFDAILAYHFLRSESAVQEFFRDQADLIKKQTKISSRVLSLKTRDRVYRPLRALFHFMRTRKKPLASRLNDWSRICREVADSFLVMAINDELIFAEQLEPGTGMKRLLAYMIQEHHARLCFSDEDKIAISSGIAGSV